MDIKIERGDIITCVINGDYGKPRPAVVVQSDLFNETHASITICPLTSHLIEAPLFRLNLKPTKSNGLGKASQIMTDKILSIKREKIAKVIGKITDEQQITLDKALKIWLDFVV